MKMWMVIMMVMLALAVSGQESELIRILENQASDEAGEMEEDIQQWQYLKKHPLNLNTAGVEEFSVFPFVTPLLIQKLELYRKLLGNLVDIHELQAVPGWGPELIKKIQPYITVKDDITFKGGVKDIARTAKHQLLTRMSIRKMSDEKFTGSRPYFLLRYQFRSDRLQFAINTEKDIGERIIQTGKGVSFVSFHLAYAGKKGPVKIFVIGDYLLNMGQGLIHWQGRAMKKTGLPIMIKRQLPMIQAYRSNDENRFHRGVAILLQKKHWSLGTFVSYKAIDANRKLDTVNSKYYVSALINSGYHRTTAELADKHSLQLTTSGGVLTYQYKGFKIGANIIVNRFSLPVIPAEAPYRKYSFRGQQMLNYSADYHYTHNNLHFFGEAAFNSSLNMALLQGLMYAVDKRLDLSLLYRKLDRSYYSFQGNAFMESVEPSNEEGIYAGASMKISNSITLDAFVDYYRFPWLRYRLDLPGRGKDFLLQFTWKPDKKTVLYGRYRRESKTENLSEEENQAGMYFFMPVLSQPGNNNSPGDRLSISGFISKANWRLNLSHIFSRQVEWRVRFEHSGVENGIKLSTGYLFFTDLFWTPPKTPVSISGRLGIFETTDYSSRIYAFENDVMYYSTIPAFFGRGMVVYANGRWVISRNAQCFLKASIQRDVELAEILWTIRFQCIVNW